MLILNERVNFQVEGRITELLGQNYSSVEHALKELIDNAWDADAENVYIHLPDSLDPEVRFITVVDDGIGMSSENIKNDYMHIARNRLVLGGDRTKIKNRKIKGRKGIGKFAGLLIANKMTVKTTQSEITTTFTLQKDSFVEATNNISEQTIPIDVVNSPDTHSGTEILLNDLDILSLTPEDYKLRQLLVLEYGREDDFNIYINDVKLEVEDIGGTNYNFKEDFGDGKKAVLNFNIADKEIKNKQAGIVLRVCEKIIGKPHSWGVEDVNYIQTKFLKRLYGEVNADFLLPYTQNSWGILEGTVDYQNLEEFVKEKIMYALNEKFEFEIEYNKKQIQKEIDAQLKNLPEHKREKAIQVIDKMLRGISDGRHSPTQIKNIVSVAIAAIESDDYYTIVEKIAQTADDDISTFADVLQEFGLIDISMIINQAIARQKFLDELQKLADNPKTLEAEIHKALEKNMWVFGMSYSLMSSNQTTRHIVEKYLNEKFTGDRANKRPDLLLSEDYTNKFLLIEFKRPDKTIDRENEAQAVQYRDDLLTKFPEKSIDITVIGKDVNSRIHSNQTQKDCILTSYDSIIADARNQLNWLINNLNK